jgi:hypothetical protein
MTFKYRAQLESLESEDKVVWLIIKSQGLENLVQLSL